MRNNFYFRAFSKLRSCSGDHGRGFVSLLGLEDRIFARLHTFGKALACSGGTLSAKI